MRINLIVRGVNGEYKMQGGNVRVKHFFNDSKGNQVFV
jgi:hypothetical protein